MQCRFQRVRWIRLRIRAPFDRLSSTGSGSETVVELVETTVSLSRYLVINTF
jgi:hypothetical protein